MLKKFKVHKCFNLFLFDQCWFFPPVLTLEFSSLSPCCFSSTLTLTYAAWGMCGHLYYEANLNNRSLWQKDRTAGRWTRTQLNECEHTKRNKGHCLREAICSSFPLPLHFLYIWCLQVFTWKSAITELLTGEGKKKICITKRASCSFQLLCEKSFAPQRYVEKYREEEELQ